MATGPGLDRPLFIPTPDYNSEGYTMNRTRLFYQDHLDAAEANAAAPTAFIYPEVRTYFENAYNLHNYKKKKHIFKKVRIYNWKCWELESSVHTTFC